MEGLPWPHQWAVMGASGVLGGLFGEGLRVALFGSSPPSWTGFLPYVGLSLLICWADNRSWVPRTSAPTARAWIAWSVYLAVPALAAVHGRPMWLVAFGVTLLIIAAGSRFTVVRPKLGERTPAKRRTSFAVR